MVWRCFGGGGRDLRMVLTDLVSRKGLTGFGYTSYEVYAMQLESMKNIFVSRFIKYSQATLTHVTYTYCRKSALKEGMCLHVLVLDTLSRASIRPFPLS